jgi:hypothetical protein
MAMPDAIAMNTINTEVKFNPKCMAAIITKEIGVIAKVTGFTIKNLNEQFVFQACYLK